jgi:hypothetical protein
MANNSRVKKRRADPLLRHRFLWEDSRRSDRKNNRENDLTKEHIQHLISRDCAYCGESTILMTLDRKDNSLGHTQDNCIACCIRCNYIRRDMPYEAWLSLVGAIRSARESGLFGAWTCSVHKMVSQNDGTD